MEVKKIAAILLVLVYVSATVGATVHLHYCMNEFVGWTLYDDRSDKCGKCGMEGKNEEGCCKDEHRHFKLKADHQNTKGVPFLSSLVTPAVVVPVSDFTCLSSIVFSKEYSNYHPPPDIQKEDLYIFYCFFLI